MKKLLTIAFCLVLGTSAAISQDNTPKQGQTEVAPLGSFSALSVTINSITDEKGNPSEPKITTLRCRRVTSEFEITIRIDHGGQS